MESIMEALGKGFERILRWIYPGALFLVLLFLSHPKSLKELLEISPFSNEWEIIIVILIAGMVVYLIHALFLNQIISIPFLKSGLLHKSDMELLRDSGEKLNKKNYMKKLVPLVNAWIEPTICKFGLNNEALTKRERERFRSYLDYAWGTYHAASITLWLAIFFLIVNEKDSKIDLLTHWGVPWFFLAISIIFFFFFLFLLWEYLVLVRLDLRASPIKSVKA